MPYTSGSILFTPSSAGTCRTPVGQSSFPLSTSSCALEFPSAPDLCDFVELAPLGSSLTETLVELSYAAHVLPPGQASSMQARFSFFDASAGYTAELLQEFLERVGSYHWAISAPKGSGIFQEFINVLAVVSQHFSLDFDGCAFGSRTKRPSRLVSSASTFSALEVGVLSCYPAHPYWQTGSTLGLLLHLLGR